MKVYNKIMEFIADFLLLSDIDMDEEFEDDAYVKSLFEMRKQASRPEIRVVSGKSHSRAV